ncbi:MAG: laccase domain-containing protein [bacterium]
MNTSSHLYTFPLLTPYEPRLVCAISNRQLGNMSFAHAGQRVGEQVEVMNNRLGFARAAGFPLENTIVLRCAYGTDLMEVTEADRAKGVYCLETALSGEILTTEETNLFLVIMVADCLAIAVIDPVKQCLAIAHAGYREVDNGVPSLAVKAMVQRYNSHPGDLLVVASPCLSRESNLMATMEFATHPDWHRFSRQTEAGWNVDFRGLAQSQVAKEGVPPSQIQFSRIDTFGSPNCFSHRESQLGGRPNGRMAMVVGFHP